MSVARLVEGEHSVSTKGSFLTNGTRFSDRWLSRYRFSSYQETILKKRIVERTASLALIGAGLIAISLAILLPAAATFAQTVSFGVATDVAVGTGPSSVASGDLNGTVHSFLSLVSVIQHLGLYPYARTTPLASL
jgi:hypothetical protein